MFQKDARLRREGFKFLHTTGRYSHTPHFRAVYRCADTPRLAVVVSKKVAASAVVRNRLRRQTAHALRATLLPKAYIAIHIGRGAQELPHSHLIEELKTLVAAVQCR